MKYCFKTTENHRLGIKYPDSLISINQLCANEGLSSRKGFEQICINLDKVEEILSSKEKRDRRHTLDFGFGTDDSNLKKFQMGDLKIRLRRPHNLSKKELDAKLNYSKSLAGYSPQLSPFSLIVVKSNIRSQTKSILSRFYRNKKIFVVLDEKEFLAWF